LVLKFFLGAFEAAWTPFFLETMREPNARRIYSTVSTYIVMLLVLLVAGLCAVAPPVVRLFTTERFQDAALVTPWIALGVMFQGLYLVGSIGLVISKRTKRYPVATGAAAAVSIVANLVLIPRFGILGAAWANTLSYATLASVTGAFSWQVYPIPYEWSRLLRIAVAGGASYVAAIRLTPSIASAFAEILVTGLLTVAVYGGVLSLTGFFHAGELKVLKEMATRLSSRRGVAIREDAAQVEMAGEIVATAPEPVEQSAYETREPEVSPGSRAPRR
jgi:O-antigen/teichoic acid export membrane protein